MTCVRAEKSAVCTDCRRRIMIVPYSQKLWVHGPTGNRCRGSNTHHYGYTRDTQGTRPGVYRKISREELQEHAAMAQERWDSGPLYNWADTWARVHGRII